MSARKKGLALPLIIIAILIPVIILAAWAPWVTPNFAYKRIKATIKPPCEEFKPNLSSQFLGVAPLPYHKLIFGTEYFFLVICPSSNIPNGNDYLVSFLGTTHKLSSTPNSSWGVRSTVSTPNETVYPDQIGANWKTYTNKKYKYSLKYPPELNFSGENPTDAISAVFANGPNDHKYNVDFPESKFIGIYVNTFETKEQNLDDYLNKKYPADRSQYGVPSFERGLQDKTITRIVIANEQGYLASSGMLFESVVKTAWIKKGSIIFEFLATHNGETGSSYTPEAGKTFDQILFTFKFLD